MYGKRIVDHGMLDAHTYVCRPTAAGTAHPSGAPEFIPGLRRVRVIRSLVLYVCFVDRCVSSCTFSFDHCVVCRSIYGF